MAMTITGTSTKRTMIENNLSQSLTIISTRPAFAGLVSLYGSPKKLINDLKLAHHAIVFVLEQVTVVHINTFVMIKTDEDSYGFSRHNQDRIFHLYFILICSRGKYLTGGRLLFYLGRCRNQNK